MPAIYTLNFMEFRMPFFFLMSLKILPWNPFNINMTKLQLTFGDFPLQILMKSTIRVLYKGTVKGIKFKGDCRNAYCLKIC